MSLQFLFCVLHPTHHNCLLCPFNLYSAFFVPLIIIFLCLFNLYFGFFVPLITIAIFVSSISTLGSSFHSSKLPSLSLQSLFWVLRPTHIIIFPNHCYQFALLLDDSCQSADSSTQLSQQLLVGEEVFHDLSFLSLPTLFTSDKDIRYVL